MQPILFYHKLSKIQPNLQESIDIKLDPYRYKDFILDNDSPPFLSKFGIEEHCSERSPCRIFQSPYKFCKRHSDSQSTQQLLQLIDDGVITSANKSKKIFFSGKKKRDQIPRPASENWTGLVLPSTCSSLPLSFFSGSKKNG